MLGGVTTGEHRLGVLRTGRLQPRGQVVGVEEDGRDTPPHVRLEWRGRGSVGAVAGTA